MRTSSRIAALLVGLYAGACSDLVEPVEEPQLLAVESERFTPKPGARHAGDACRTRLDVYRSTSAEAGTGTVVPDTAASDLSQELGLFNSTQTVGSGSGGAGAQAQSKQFTTVDCDTWSIGKTQFLSLRSSGWSEMLSEAKVSAGGSQPATAGARSDLVIRFTLERKAQVKFVVDLFTEWREYDPPTSACQRLQAVLARKTLGDEATLSFSGVTVCDPADVPYTMGDQLAGFFEPGDYELRIGNAPLNDVYGNDVSASLSGPSHGFVRAYWKFQLWVDEQ